MITRGLTLFATRPLNRWLGALLALGGFLFPLGRAVGVEWAVTTCDIVLSTTFVAVEWQVFTRPELWLASEEQDAKAPLTASSIDRVTMTV